ncbi:MAG: HNH endonuclease [Chloroflexota bacterium]|nr:HNH endonuclease [Chloroflexota bacterium]
MAVVSAELADSILARDGWTCRYCHGPVRPAPVGGPVTDDTATIDHLVPKAAGGGDDSMNLVTACWRCNRRKGSQILPVERIRREQRLSGWLGAQQRRARARTTG